MGVSRYPTDKSQSSARVQSKQCAIDWIETYPVDNVIQLSVNLGQNVRIQTFCLGFGEPWISIVFRLFPETVSKRIMKTNYLLLQ